MESQIASVKILTLMLPKQPTSFGEGPFMSRGLTARPHEKMPGDTRAGQIEGLRLLPVPRGTASHRCLCAVDSLGRSVSMKRGSNRRRLGILIAFELVHRTCKEVCYGGDHDGQGVSQIPQDEGGNDLSVCSGGATSRNQNQRAVAI